MQFDQRNRDILSKNGKSSGADTEELFRDWSLQPNQETGNCRESIMC